MSSSRANWGISLLFAPTSTWPNTGALWWVAAASRWVWFAVGVGGAAYRLAVHHDREWLGCVLVASPVATSTVAASRAAARASSQAPITASTASASAPVTTRQMVGFDGGSLRRRWSRASISAVTSLAQPAIAVNEAMPATTAAAYSASTTATG